MLHWLEFLVPVAVVGIPVFSVEQRRWLLGAAGAAPVTLALTIQPVVSEAHQLAVLAVDQVARQAEHNLLVELVRIVEHH